MRRLILAAIAILFPVLGHAATYVVVSPGTTPGSGQFASLVALTAAQNNSPFIQPGDTIQLPAVLGVCDGMEGGMWNLGTPSNPVTFTGPPGGYAIVQDGGACLRNGKAPFTFNSDNVVVNHVIFLGNYGGSDGNGAGIRMGVAYGVADSNGKYPPYNLKVTNSAFISNGNGILADDCTSDTSHVSVFAPSPSATSSPCSITVDHSWFSANGDGSGLTHNLYIDTVDQLTFTNNLSTFSLYGHLLKSRALNTDIENNRFFDGTYGLSNNDIDIPVGGNLTIKGNVIQKGQYSINDGMLISYNEENYPPLYNNPGVNVDIENNTIIDNWSNSALHPGNTAIFFQDGSWWPGKNGNCSTCTNVQNPNGEVFTLVNNHFYSQSWTAASANTSTNFFRYGWSKDVLGSGNTFATSGAPVLDMTLPMDLGWPATTNQTLTFTMNGLQLDTNTGIHNPGSTDLSTFPQVAFYWNGSLLNPAPIITADNGAGAEQTVTFTVPVIAGAMNFATPAFQNPGCCFSPAVNGQTGRLPAWQTANLNGTAASPFTPGFIFDTLNNPPAGFLGAGGGGPPPTDTTPPVLQPITTPVLTAGTTTTLRIQSADPDNTTGQLTYAVTNAPTHGTLKVSGTPASTWTQAAMDSGNVTYTASGTTAATDNFTFTITDPAGNFVSGTQPITINAATSPPGPGPTLSHSAVTIAVTAGQASLILPLVATDPNYTSSQLTYTITTTPAYGTIKKGGASVTTFTQADVSAGLVSYVSTGTATAIDLIRFSVANPASQSATGTMQMVITPPMPAPYTVTPGVNLIPHADGGWYWK